MDLNRLFTAAVERKASDLHIIASYPPILRINGQLHTLVTFPLLENDQIEQMIYSILTPSQKEILINNKELDFSSSVSIEGSKEVRIRSNTYFQKGTLAASFRFIPSFVPSFEELNLPSVLKNFCDLKQGLILITGASGQGKSTTLASIIQNINLNRKLNIITIEDPIEYVYPQGKSTISQREMHQDTHSWNNALRAALRQDPDVVFIGEVRDKDTISSALTIAETGHLVFSTLHTNSAAQTVDRIIDIFPPIAQQQIRMQLSMVIEGIVTQRLVPAASGGRIPVCEILIGTHSVKNAIREGNTHLIDNIIQTSAGNGMVIFEAYLKRLVDRGVITQNIALEYAFRPDRYLQMIGR